MMMPKHFDGGSSIFLLGACEWVEFRVGAGILWERLQPEWEAQVGTYAPASSSPLFLMLRTFIALHSLLILTSLGAHARTDAPGYVRAHPSFLPVWQLPLQSTCHVSP